MPNEQKKCPECQFEEDHSQACSKYVEDMPFTPTEEKIYYENATPEQKRQILTEVVREANEDQRKVMSVPTVSKWEEEFERMLSTQKGTQRELPVLWEVSIKDFIHRLLSSKIDIDEVIEMIEGMRQEKHEITEDDFRPRDCSCPACYSAGCFNLALSSLKQKLEAKRKEK